MEKKNKLKIMKHIKTYEFFNFDNEDDKIVKNIISNINDVEIILDRYSIANPYEISFYYKHERFKLEKEYFDYSLVVNNIEIDSKYNSNLFKILIKKYNDYYKKYFLIQKNKLK